MVSNSFKNWIYELTLEKILINKSAIKFEFIFLSVLESDLDKGIGLGRPLDETDFANGDKINTNARVGTNPITDAIEKSGEFEGDIKLNVEQAAIIANGTEEALVALRAATTVNYHKWTKSGSNARVPYVLSSSFSSSERANIARAISEFESKTCIRYKIRFTFENISFI